VTTHLPLDDTDRRAFVELYAGLTHRQFDDEGLFPGGQVLSFDLLKPVAAAPTPLLVFVKGGGFRNNHRSRYLPALTRIAEHGVAVASIEYRTSNQAPFRASLDDVLHGVRYLREHAERLNVDPARTAIWGNSAGATLALHAAGALRGEETLAAAVGWYGVYDPAAEPSYLEPESSMRLALGAPSAQQWFTPADIVHPLMPPVFLAHGTADTTVPPAQSELLAEELRRRNVPHDYVLVEGARHSFAQFCTRSDALERTTEFLLTHLRSPADRS